MQCSSCAYPTEAEPVASLEKTLDPALAANQKCIRRLERSWKYEELEKSLHSWKVLLVGMPIILMLLFAIAGSLMLLGIDPDVKWTLPLTLIAWFVLYRLVFLRSVMNGRLRWFLRV
jgi:hypothetical protein